MMRSLFSGVSGLKSHQTRMDVIGNNIANVNTTAYKSMQLNFSDVMYQTTQAATGPNPETKRAGMNPKQIGLGVQTAAITTKIAEQGATQTTGNPFDLKISGDEFFIVSNGAQTFFTRDGSFYVDAAGNLAMSASGYNVMGWQVDEATQNIKKDTVSPIVVMGEGNATYPAEWTSQAIVSGVVDWFDENQSEKAGKTLNLQIYDKLGYSYTVKMSLHNGRKAENVNENYTYYVEVDDILDSQGNTILDTQEKRDKVKFGSSGTVDVTEKYGLNNGQHVAVTTGASVTSYAKFNVEDTSVVPQTDPPTMKTVSVCLYDQTGTVTDTLFDKDKGTVKGTVTLSDGTSMAGDELFALLYGTSVDPKNIQAADFDVKTGNLIIKNKQVDKGSVLTYSGKDGQFLNATGGTEASNTELDLSGLSDAFTKISIDFTKSLVSDNKGKSTVGAEKGDLSGLGAGRSLGKLQGVSIGTDGIIRASYSNNQSKVLGQIAVAQFANPSGLQKEGENLYTATTNSGDFDGIGVDISVTGDKMNTGVLEMSNVDLSAEFTDMITTQRGFQANSRIITVSDTLLEELVNLKR